MTRTPHTFESHLEWPIDEMPAMPLEQGLIMVRNAAQQNRIFHGITDPALDRQHRLAVREAANKWEIQQSRLKTETAHRFGVRADGWAKLLAALGGGSVIGSVVTLLVEHLLLS